MSISQRLGDVVAERARRSFVGREEELAMLEDLVGPAGEASVVHVHGDAGIGKSALVARLLARLEMTGAATVALDCRSIEPTERGLIEALAMVSESEEHDVDAIVAGLGSLGGPVVVTLDHFEVFRLMDTWLRQVLVPALDEDVRVLLVGREAPVGAWFGAGWDGLFHSVALGPLVDDEAELLLTARGHPPDEARRLNRIARGHPLALTLASAAARERPDLVLEEAATTRVVTELTRIYLEDVPDPLTRRALEAASVIRRVTQPLLGAMLRESESQDAFDRLLTLPFVDVGSDGVLLHDAVREPISSFLRSTDPSRHRDYRRAAWRRLRSEVRDAARRGAVAIHGGHAVPDREPRGPRGLLPERRPAARGRAGPQRGRGRDVRDRGTPRRSRGRRAAGGLVGRSAEHVLGRPRPRRRAGVLRPARQPDDPAAGSDA